MLTAFELTGEWDDYTTEGQCLFLILSYYRIMPPVEQYGERSLVYCVEEGISMLPDATDELIEYFGEITAYYETVYGREEILRRFDCPANKKVPVTFHVSGPVLYIYWS